MVGCTYPILDHGRLGAQICGFDVPSGCIIALPPYAMDVYAATYGSDAEQFNPER